jgi:nitrite reductase/ring-hydroxylating ferredoxin subunit
MAVETLVAFPAHCLHLDGPLRSRPEEESWNWPRHGARFEGQTGEVLNGPATAPLPPFERGQDDEGGGLR